MPFLKTLDQVPALFTISCSLFVHPTLCKYVCPFVFHLFPHPSVLCLLVFTSICNIFLPSICSWTISLNLPPGCVADRGAENFRLCQWGDEWLQRIPCRLGSLRFCQSHFAYAFWQVRGDVWRWLCRPNVFVHVDGGPSGSIKSIIGFFLKKTESLAWSQMQFFFNGWKASEYE